MAFEYPPDPIAREWYPLIVDFIRRVTSAFQQVPGFMLVPTSWYRDPAHNAAVGGDPYSQHQVALALDVQVEFSGISSSMAREVAAWFARRQGLTAVVEADHLHLQLLPAGTLQAWGVTF